MQMTITQEASPHYRTYTTFRPKPFRRLSLAAVIGVGLALGLGVTALAQPTITCPANQTINSTNPVGAVVTYPAPTVTPANATVSCTPASGTIFGPGTTTVNCTATLSGATASCSFTVQVNAPPAITCSPNLTVMSSTPTRVDYISPIIFPVGTPTTCTPPSGSTFALGTTTVTCTATSPTGVPGMCSFTVTVSPGGTTPQRSTRCSTLCFRSPQYYLLNLNRLPGGTVLISGVNGNRPISTDNKELIELALRGNVTGVGTLTPQQRFNQEFLATQLSVNAAGGPGSPRIIGAFNSELGCNGFTFTSVTLSNGTTISPATTLGDLFQQAYAVIRDNRTADMGPLAAMLDQLNGNSLMGLCSR